MSCCQAKSERRIQTFRRLPSILLVLAGTLLLGEAARAQAGGGSGSTVPPPLSQAINHQPGNGQPSSVFLADVNGDGYLDVIVANQNGNNGDGSVSVFLGNGDGTLQPPVNYDSGGRVAVSVFAIDVNADGVLDLVVANQGPINGDGSVSVLIGKGDGTFQPAATYDSGGPGATSVFVADVNGDGLPDIVVANQGSSSADGSVSVLLNRGGGVFNPAVTYDSGGVDATALTLADVNGDGFPDIIVANYCYPLGSCPQQQGGVAVLLNDKAGHFGAAASYPVAGPATSIAAGDVNGDGILDIFVGVSTYGAGFLAGEGTGNFGAYQPIAGVEGQVISVAVRDMNGDSINDLLIGLGYCASCDIGLGSGETVLLGMGGGSYGSPVIYTTGGQLAGAIALGDLNGDGKPDVVIPNQCDDGIIDTSCGGNVAILLNSSSILTTNLVSSLNPALAGQAVTYTATVAELGTPPAGTVTFRDGTSVIANDVPLTLNAGQYQATYSTSYSTAGTHQISATYSLAPISQISSILAETVLNSTAMTLISSLPASAPGQKVTFTAAITPTQGVIPDGEVVTFSDGVTPIGTGTTVGGEATFMTSTLAAGSHTIAANYPGDATFAASSASTTELVQTLVIPPSPVIQSVTPNVGLQGQQGLSVTISGSNFVAGATSATFGGGNTGISVVAITVNSPTSATALLNIAPSTPPGSYDVVVTVTGAAAPATLSGGFTVAANTASINVSETIHVLDSPGVPPPYLMTGIVAPVASYSAGSLGFVGVAPGQTVTQSLTLANVGLQPLKISAASIAQDTSNSFSITQVVCSDGATSIIDTLASSTECTLTISYTAPATGTPSGKITFSDNAPLSNLTSTASGSNFTQSLALGTSVATTAAPPDPPTTISISIPEIITVNDQESLSTLRSIAVTPAGPTIAEGATEAFTATGTYSDGSTQNLTSAVSWSSSNTAVATMNGNTATAATGNKLGTLGTSTITATLGSTQGSSVLTVDSQLKISATLKSITLGSGGTYVVTVSVSNNGDISATSVAAAGLLGGKVSVSSTSAKNLAPGSTASVALVFPASVGKPGAKESLLVAGTATGSNPNGTPVLPTGWILQQLAVTLP